MKFAATFTAIGCVDRLSASLSRARDRGLCLGAFTDDSGTARAIFPTIDAEVLFATAFAPLRRAARGNGLMVSALTRAMRRVAMAAPSGSRSPYVTQIRRLREDLDGCGLPEGDRQGLADAIDRVLEEVGT